MAGLAPGDMIGYLASGWLITAKTAGCLARWSQDAGCGWMAMWLASHILLSVELARIPIWLVAYVASC